MGEFTCPRCKGPMGFGSRMTSGFCVSCTNAPHPAVPAPGVPNKTAPNLPPDGTFGIEFDTKNLEGAGAIKYVKVTLSHDVLMPDESVFVNLCEHPLYPALEKYVRANMTRNRRDRK